MKSSNQKIYINYFCNNTKTFSCYLEIDTGVSFFSKNNTPNFMALKVRYSFFVYNIPYLRTQRLNSKLSELMSFELITHFC